MYDCKHWLFEDENFTYWPNDKHVQRVQKHKSHISCHMSHIIEHNIYIWVCVCVCIDCVILYYTYKIPLQ